MLAFLLPEYVVRQRTWNILKHMCQSYSSPLNFRKLGRILNFSRDWTWRCTKNRPILLLVAVIKGYQAPKQHKKMTKMIHSPSSSQNPWLSLVHACFILGSTTAVFWIYLGGMYHILHEFWSIWNGKKRRFVLDLSDPKQPVRCSFQRIYN